MKVCDRVVCNKQTKIKATFDLICCQRSDVGNILVGICNSDYRQSEEKDNGIFLNYGEFK